MLHYSAIDFPFQGAINHLLSQSVALKNRIFDKHLAQRNLQITTSQFETIVLIGLRHIITPHDLCRELAIDSGPMTRLLDRLERKELIQRKRSSQDRRRVNLELTENGQAIYLMAPDISAKALNEMVGVLTSNELGTLNRLLTQMLGTPEATHVTRA